jgi:lipoyl-dependent peroxiredoxin
MAITRKAQAQWNGDLKAGKGEMSLGSGAFKGAYSFGTRFEAAPGTNPEELIGAAHAGCFSMALSGALGRAGFTPKSVRTNSTVTLDKVGEGFGITRIDLETEASIPGIDDAKFQEIAKSAKENCPVSKALSATPIHLKAKLVQ